MSEKNYVTHTCRNSKLKPLKSGIFQDSSTKRIEHPDYCFRAFVDVDKHHTTTVPPTWKYCPACVAKGFKNPKTRPDNLTPEQKLKRLDNLQRGRLQKINSLTETTQQINI